MNTRHSSNRFRAACNGLLASVLFVACSAAGAADSGLSASEKRTLLRIAESHPSAAVALLFFDKESVVGTSGTLLFEGNPSVEAVRVLLDETGGAARDTRELMLPRNPYSTAGYFIEVRWTLSKAGDSAIVLSTQAQLVDRDGAPLHPSHPLEAPMTLLIAGKNFSLTAALADSAIAQSHRSL